MIKLCAISFTFAVLAGIGVDAYKLRSHRFSRRHRALPNDGALRFEPEPYNKKLELNSSGKIHCKVAGGTAPVVNWYLNEEDPLPDGVTSSNGTLLVTSAERRHNGQYTCRAKDGDTVITASISLDVVVSPVVVTPLSGQVVHAKIGDNVTLDCTATGDPTPTIHWDRRRTTLGETTDEETVDLDNGFNSSRFVVTEGTLTILNATTQDADEYGCTAGSSAGLARSELVLQVHTEADFPPPSLGVGGRAVTISMSVAGGYMVLVVALMIFCRRRRRRAVTEEKLELEMAEGREKLVEEGEDDKKVVNGVAHNGRLLNRDKDSGADNSESCVSRTSKKSGHYDNLAIPSSLLTEQITLGRGEFGDVLLAKIDMSQVRKLRHKEIKETEVEMKPVLVKVLTTKDETQLCEFRRQLELLSRVRHESVVRLVGLCTDSESHCMVLQHTDWGELKQFLLTTRTADEDRAYVARVGPRVPPPRARDHVTSRPTRDHVTARLSPSHALSLSTQLARGAAAVAQMRLTHRDIASRNCLITSKLQLKLSFPAMTRGPYSQEYYKLHDQVIPLRWLPPEAVLEGEYSTKSDVYMFAATVWEIYTKAELPFAKLNDNSIMERIKNSSLEWHIPEEMPETLVELLKKCWSKSPTERPLFDTICEEVITMMKVVTEAPDSSEDNIEEQE